MKLLAIYEKARNWVSLLFKANGNNFRQTKYTVMFGHQFFIFSHIHQTYWSISLSTRLDFTDPHVKRRHPALEDSSWPRPSGCRQMENHRRQKCSISLLNTWKPEGVKSGLYRWSGTHSQRQVSCRAVERRGVCGREYHAVAAVRLEYRARLP